MLNILLNIFDRYKACPHFFSLIFFFIPSVSYCKGLIISFILGLFEVSLFDIKKLRIILALTQGHNFRSVDSFFFFLNKMKINTTEMINF